MKWTPPPPPLSSSPSQNYTFFSSSSSSMAAASPPSLSLSLDSSFQPFLLPPYSSSSASFSPASSPFSSLRWSYPTSFLRYYPSIPATFSLKPSAVGAFVAPDAPEKSEVLEKFCRRYHLESGSLEVRPMRSEELDATANLLAESFAESMWMPPRYVPLLAFLVKQYLIERRELAPHMAVLVGFYKQNGGVGEEGKNEQDPEKESETEPQLACTAEIAFDAIGANAATPTPATPKECPYICNMSVKESLRRRRIAWHLLEACEELIREMKARREVYLHCRVIDKGPFDMYKKFGYKVVKTDKILVWLTLQRRKYLMCKQISPRSDDISSTTSHTDDHQT